MPYKMMPVLPNPKRSTGFSIDSLMSKDRRGSPKPAPENTRHSPAPGRSQSLPQSVSLPSSRPGTIEQGTQPHCTPSHPLAVHPSQGVPPRAGPGVLGHLYNPPHPAFINGAVPAQHHVFSPETSMLPPHAGLDPATLAHLLPNGHPGPAALFGGGLGAATPAAGLPGLGGHGLPSHPGLPPLNPHLLGLTQKDNFPFYTWLLSRHGGMINRGLTGKQNNQLVLIQLTYSQSNLQPGCHILYIQ